MDLRTENIDRAFLDLSTSFRRFGEVMSVAACSLVNAIDQIFLIRYASADMQALSERIIQDECPWYDDHGCCDEIEIEEHGDVCF